MYVYICMYVCVYMYMYMQFEFRNFGITGVVAAVTAFALSSAWLFPPGRSKGPKSFPSLSVARPYVSAILLCELGF
jgi:hypothetical protein